MRNLARYIAMPIAASVLLLSFIAAYHAMGLPEGEEFVQLGKTYFDRYGYVVIFVAAFVEALLLVNLYLPGSAVVVLGVILARESNQSVPFVLLAAGVAFLSAYLVDYWAGRYGWHALAVRFGLKPSLDRSRTRLEAHGLRWLFLSYVHPNLGSIAATACGTLHISFRLFLLWSLVPLAFWTAFWGMLAYTLGPAMTPLLNMMWLVPVVIVWLVISIVRGILKNRADGAASNGHAE